MNGAGGDGAARFPAGRALRPRTKLLPEHTRGHNRSLVLQTIYTEGSQSRADVARATGLTRVTVSDLVAELIADGLLVETGQREDARPGKRATLLDLDRSAFQVVGIDISELADLRGAVLDLNGVILHRAQVTLEGAIESDALDRVVQLVTSLMEQTTRPVLGIGVGSPGIVDLRGTVLRAANLGWVEQPLEQRLFEIFGLPVVVANDANVAVLAEYGFGEADGDTIFVKVGNGIGAGLLLGGSLVLGSRFAAGEIGHVVVGTDGGEECECGKTGCLATWIATPYLTARLERERDADGRAAVLREAGYRLGIALAPIVGALNLVEIVISGPPRLFEGPLAETVKETVLHRTMHELHGDVTVRTTALGDDIVIQGAAVMVISRVLGVS